MLSKTFNLILRLAKGRFPTFRNSLDLDHPHDRADAGEEAEDEQNYETQFLPRPNLQPYEEGYGQ